MPDNMYSNSKLGKAYIAATKGKTDDEGIPYADKSGKQDTDTYVLPTGMNGSFASSWYEKLTGSPEYSDGSWLPSKPGQTIIVPEELIPYLPIPDDGFTIKPGPDFTPPGKPKVPSVIIAPNPKAPRNPGPGRRRGPNDAPRYPRPQLPESL